MNLSRWMKRVGLAAASVAMACAAGCGGSQPAPQANLSPTAASPVKVKPSRNGAHGSPTVLPGQSG